MPNITQGKRGAKKSNDSYTVCSSRKQKKELVPVISLENFKWNYKENPGLIVLKIAAVRSSHRTHIRVAGVSWLNGKMYEL